MDDTSLAKIRRIHQQDQYEATVTRLLDAMDAEMHRIEQEKLSQRIDIYRRAHERSQQKNPPEKSGE